MALSLPTSAALDPALPAPASGTPGAQGSTPPGVFALALAGARRRWLIASLTGLFLGGACAVGYYAFTPQKYTVATTLQIAPSDQILREGTGGDTERAELNYRKNQAALIRTHPVVVKALETKDVASASFLKERPDPVGWLELQLQTATYDGGLIRVSLTGENPNELATTLNAVADAYLSVVVDKELRVKQHNNEELDKALASFKDRLSLLRNELRTFAQTYRTSDTQSMNLKQQVVLQEYASVQKEVLERESQLRTESSLLEVRKARLEASQNKPVPDDLLTDALAADPDVKVAAAAAATLRSQLDKSPVQPGTALHDTLLEKVNEANKKVEEIKAKRRDTVLKALRDSLIRKHQADVSESEVRVGALEHQIGELRPKVAEALRKAEQIGLGSLGLELTRSEMAGVETYMQKLRDAKERLAIEMLTYKPRVTVIAPAEAGGAKPAASAVTVSIGLGVAGLAFGVMGVGYLESRRRRLIHSRDVAHVMKLRVLGNLPSVPGLGNGQLVGVWSDQFGAAGSLLVEAITDIRTMLLAGGEGRAPQVVMVTSAGQGEGKTTLSCLLALSLAQIGKRILLIDGDLRKPQVTERLGLPSAAGLGEVLRGEARPLGVIAGVPGTPLAVMSAGRPCQTVIRGLSFDRVRQVFAELRQQFDYIVVDSCPTPMTDGLILGSCADAAVLVVRSGQSEESVVREACERMLAVRVPLVGGIMNCAPVSSRWMRYPYAIIPAEPRTEPSLPAAPSA